MAHIEPGSGALRTTLARRRKRRRLLWAGVLAIAALGLAGGWWFSLAPPLPPPQPTTAEAPVPPTPKPAPPPLPPLDTTGVEEITIVEAEVPIQPTLPGLDSSDAPVRETAYRIARSSVLADFLNGEGLIRRFVMAIDNIAEGRSPTGPLGALRPSRPFQATWDGESLTPSPTNWQRYDAVGFAVTALDAHAVARLYLTWRPRIEEAYRELGYPEGGFSRVLLQALRELLSVPVIEGIPTLTPDGIGYGYADPELEALSPAQKQLLRMGPENTKRVQTKLRELARRLEIAENSLPKATVYRADAGANLSN